MKYEWGTYKAAGILEGLVEQSGHHAGVSKMLNKFFSGCNRIEDIRDLSFRRTIFTMWREHFIEQIDAHPYFTALEKSHLKNVIISHYRELAYRKLLKCPHDNTAPELYIKTIEGRTSYKYECPRCFLHTGWKYSQRRAKVYWCNVVTRTA